MSSHFKLKKHIIIVITKGTDIFNLQYDKAYNIPFPSFQYDIYEKYDKDTFPHFNLKVYTVFLLSQGGQIHGELHP